MGIRILVVEDEPPIADFIARGLREEGFTVEHAADGDTARHALRTGSWDVVLLDRLLPGVDGLTLLRRDQAGATILTSHGVRLDLATRRADRNNHTLDLTAKEEALLLFFLRHP